MKISMIAAMAEKSRVIGRDNRLPWNIPEDLQYFRRTTTGKPVIMGRKTFESIGKALPNRTNFVLTRDQNYRAPEGVQVELSLELALNRCRALGCEEAMIIGGAEIYRQALPIVDRIYLTLVHQAPEGDAFFPELDPDEFIEVRRDTGAAGQCTFVVYERSDGARFP